MVPGTFVVVPDLISWRVTTNEIIWSEAIYRIFEFDPSMRVTLEIIASRVHPDDMAVFVCAVLVTRNLRLTRER